MGHARDSDDWETLAACFHSDATIHLSWISGLAKDFPCPFPGYGYKPHTGYPYEACDFRAVDLGQPRSFISRMPCKPFIPAPLSTDTNLICNRGCVFSICSKDGKVSGASSSVAQSMKKTFRPGRSARRHPKTSLPTWICQYSPPQRQKVPLYDLVRNGFSLRPTSSCVYSMRNES